VLVKQVYFAESAYMRAHQVRMRVHELVPGFAGKRPETLLSCTSTGFCMDGTLTRTNATGVQNAEQAPSLLHGTMTAAL